MHAAHHVTAAATTRVCRCIHTQLTLGACIGSCVCIATLLLCVHGALLVHAPTWTVATSTSTSASTRSCLANTLQLADGVVAAMLWHTITPQHWSCHMASSPSSKRSLSGGDTDKRPVFVVGCGNSGTTITTRLLGAHPSLFAYPEETAAFEAPTERDREARLLEVHQAALRAGCVP